jgi:CubicO group peptidase (beta-lactamase class C family)
MLLHEAVIGPGVARAAAAGFAVWTGGRWEVEVGACGKAGRGAASVTTIFDLASVSKPFVAVTYARLVERGTLTANALLGDLLPEVRGTWAAKASLEALLSHRAGLASHVRLFAPLEARRAVRRLEALRQAADSPSDEARTAGAGASFPAVYSDLGYVLAGAALARQAGVDLDELVLAEVSEPLGLRAGSARQWLAAAGDFSERVAPTEVVAFRGGELRGVVHDENAWALAGHGLAGQAGLFGTVEDVLGFGVALLDGLAGRRAEWLAARTIEGLLVERPLGTLRLGFDGKASANSSAGPSASAHTFGHLGFTGTSLWCDPAADAVSVLLTNRVCPTRENVAIRACRPEVHESLFARARERQRRPGPTNTPRAY